MPRRGSFSRLPRAQPNLTSTIVALAREMANQRANNIMTAWEKGGTFEGKTVTDADILAYWKERMDGVGGGATYDQYKSTYDQIAYNIAETKQGLLYEQGKINDRQMAQFYLNWSLKVPRDSAFWRTLQTDAAAFMSAHSARGRAAAAAAEAAAYAAAQEKIRTEKIANGELLTQVLTGWARQAGLIGETQDLSDFMLHGQNDPGRMEALLAARNESMRADPVGWKPLIDAIRATDPGWDGNLTSAYFANALTTQASGYTDAAAYAADKGKASAAKQYTKDGEKVTTIAAGVGSWAPATAYSVARKSFETVWNRPGITDADRAQAAEAFASAIDRVSALPGVTPRQRMSLENDAAALRGDPTAAGLQSYNENYLGNQHLTYGEAEKGGLNPTGENELFSTTMAEVYFWQAQMDANPGFYTYAHYKTDAAGTRVFDPDGTGPIGIVSKASVLSNPQETTTVPVALATGGIIMQAANVKGVYVDDPAGGAPTLIGHVLTTTTGGLRTSSYSLDTPSTARGEDVWTSVPPWAAGVSATTAADGTVHLTVPPSRASQSDRARRLAAKGLTSEIVDAFSGDPSTYPPSGSSWTGTNKATGQKYTVTWVDGHFTEQFGTSFTEPGDDGYTTGATTAPVVFEAEAVRQELLASTWDQSRSMMPPNPRIDFASKIMAHLVAQQATGADIASIWANPEFQAALQAAQIQAAGGDVQKLQLIARIDREIALSLARDLPSQFGPYSQAPSQETSRVKQAQVAAIIAGLNPNETAYSGGATPGEDRYRPSLTLKVPGQPTGGLYGTERRDGLASGLISEAHPAIVPKVPDAAIQPSGVILDAKLTPDAVAPPPISSPSYQDYFEPLPRKLPGLAPRAF